MTVKCPEINRKYNTNNRVKSKDNMDKYTCRTASVGLFCQLFKTRVKNKTGGLMGENNYMDIV